MFVPAMELDSMRIDINADVGESFGAYSIGDDAALMRCDLVGLGRRGVSRRRSLGPSPHHPAGRSHGVAVGAHPGFPDLVGFGRRELNVPSDDAEHFVLYQIAAVAGVAAAEGVRLQHVKPHGALFNMASATRALAAAIAKAVAAFDRR